jgi:RNA polymerase sigma factor (sigma-70 family)
MILPRLLTENSLSQKAAAGDPVAFEEIFRRFHQDIFRYCRSILGNDQDAMDALQATMASALGSLPGESREIRLKPWLFRVAHNECIDLMKARSRLVHGEAASDSGYVLESEVADRERLRQVLSDIGRLPEGQRSALIMRELNGLRFEEVGFALGCSAAAARQAVYEARLSLAELEKGRQMRCDDARQAISSMDGRVMRGRSLRAHLRSCQGCQGFRNALRVRQGELRSLVPVLPAAAAASMLGAIGGGGSGLGGGLFAFLGGGTAAGVGGKAVAIVAVTAVGLGAGTAGVVRELEQPGDRVRAESIPSTSSASDPGSPPYPRVAAGLRPGDGPPKTPFKARRKVQRVEGVAPSEGTGKETGPAAAGPTATGPVGEEQTGAAAAPSGEAADAGQKPDQNNGKSGSAPGRSPAGPPGRGAGPPAGAGSGNGPTGGPGPPQHSQGRGPASVPTPPPHAGSHAASPGKPPKAGPGGPPAGGGGRGRADTP